MTDVGQGEPSQGEPSPARGAAVMALGLVVLFAVAAVTGERSSVTASAPVERLAPAPEQAGPPVVAVAGPTRSLPAVTPPPVVLGAGLTRAEADARAARILREERPDGSVTVDLSGWPTAMTITSPTTVPEALSARLSRELGVWITLFRTSPSP